MTELWDVRLARIQRDWPEHYWYWDDRGELACLDWFSDLLPTIIDETACVRDVTTHSGRDGHKET